MMLVMGSTPTSKKVPRNPKNSPALAGLFLDELEQNI